MDEQHKTELRRLLGDLHRYDMTADELQDALRRTLEAITGIESHEAANMNVAEEKGDDAWYKGAREQQTILRKQQT